MAFSSRLRSPCHGCANHFATRSGYSKLLFILGKGDFDMSQPLTQTMPILHGLPITLPRDGAIQLDFEQGVLVFRVSQAVQDRIEELLSKQRAGGLSQAEAEELEQYEDIDDYLSFTNRLLRNLKQTNEEGSESAT
jgi:uncharacterized protein YnzC (UPF0291/DUF896 family)